MESRDGWRARTSGIVVPADLADEPPPPENAPDRSTGRAEQSAARAAWVAAFAAIAALVVSGLTYRAQNADAADRHRAEERANAARVQIWTDFAGAIIVQNASPAVLFPVILSWESDAKPPKTTLQTLASTLQPCTRWTLSLANPAIKHFYDRFQMPSVVFIDPNGAWKVTPLITLVKGPDYKPPRDADVLMTEWDPKYMRADPVPDCGTSS